MATLQVGQRKEFIVLTSDEFDKMATEFLGREYEFIPTHEANNYSSYEFNVNEGDIDWFDKWDAADLEKKAMPAPRVVLCAMIKAGLLDYGDYLVQVYW